MSTKTKTAKPSTNGAAHEPAYTHPLARCRPRGDRVVIKRDIAGEKRVGNILLPDSYDDGKRQTGVVWAVGPGARHPQTGELVPLDLKKGDRVIITGWAGLEVNDGIAAAGGKNDEFVLLRDEDVVALLPA